MLNSIGNVFESRGSLMPLFIGQIRKGIPLTITYPNVTRFIMSLGLNVNLILFAYQNGNPRDILVQKAPDATI